MVTPVASGDWMSKSLVDMLGTSFNIGDRVARAVVSGRSANLNISEVSRIDEGKLYLDGSKVAIKYPGRLLIVNKIVPAQKKQPEVQTYTLCVEHFPGRFGNV